MNNSESHHDYVIKNGKLVGNWEDLYKNIDDPWMQSRLDHRLDTRRQISIIGSTRLRAEFNISKVLEFGCGFGYITQSLTDLNFDSLGIDISNQAIAKAKQINPASKYLVGEFDDFNLIYNF